MNPRHLLLLTAWCISASAALVTLCYLLIDRSMAFWVHDHRLAIDVWMREPLTVEPWLWRLAPWAVVVLALRRAFGPWRHWELALLAAALNVLVIYAVKEQLQWLFGRPWPLTWIDNNPSLIANGEYAFHWFDGSDRFGSFPSGHTTEISAVASIVWFAWPKLRILAVIAVALVAIGLLLNNYHFVGDIVAGGFLGWLGGAWAACLLGLTPDRPTNSPVQDGSDSVSAAA